MIDMRNDVSILPSPEMTDEALCHLAQQSSGPAAEDLVKRYTRLVKTCARPYFLAGADAEDVIQEGMLGLMKAIREFDSTKGVPFGVFAPAVYSAKNLFRNTRRIGPQARTAQPVHVTRSTSV